MAVQQTIIRYFHIINRIRRSPTSYKEIEDYLSFQSDLQGVNFVVSKRQFQRDLLSISSIFEIDINYNSSKGIYEINNEEISEISKRRMEALDTFNALKICESIVPFIHFESRKPLGTENLFDIIHAIKNRLIINFNYQKFWEDEVTRRSVEPYTLKEFKGRWYVLAKDKKDDKIKSFALDRIIALEISCKKFIYPADFKIEKYYQNCFGIINSDNQNLQEIILSFNPVQGEYIKTMPLHESQEVLEDSDRELRIRLTLYITYDFLLEILSHGDTVKVISPEILIKQIKNTFKNALRQYSNKKI